MYFLGMSAIYDDPMNQLNTFSSLAEPNFSLYKSQAYEALLEKIKTTPLGEARAELARQANRMVAETDVVVVPIVLRLQVFGVSKKLNGFKVSPYQVIDLAHLSK
jgi:ABC-type oligopeptide transport system substrate-binding subunit